MSHYSRPPPGLSEHLCSQSHESREKERLEAQHRSNLKRLIRRHKPDLSSVIVDMPTPALEALASMIRENLPGEKTIAPGARTT